MSTVRAAGLAPAFLVLALCGCREASHETAVAAQRAVAEHAASHAAKSSAAQAASHSAVHAGGETIERIAHTAGHHLFTEGERELQAKLREKGESDEKWRNRILAKATATTAEAGTAR
jgi:hypothetical protein